ncbi:MAG: hypothetical protein JNK27_00010 [Chitinophagaceae bacterium]|nr:hypothetical protein [Chitinophagaceae bacterium]
MGILNQKHRECLLLTFLLASIWTLTYGNDTIRLNKRIILDNYGYEYAPGYLLLNNKYWEVGYHTNNGHFNYFAYNKKRFSQVYFKNSTFSAYQVNGEKLTPQFNSGFYILDSCNLEHLTIANTTGDIRLVGSKLSVLEVQNTKDLQLSINNDSALQYLVFQDNRNLSLQFIASSFQDSAMVKIFNTTFKQFDYGYSLKSGSDFYFSRDTINWFVTGMGPIEPDSLKSYRKWYKYKNTFLFDDCYINCDFTFFESIPNSTFIFNKCRFGPNAFMGDMAVDEMIFQNCIQINPQLTFKFREENEAVRLGMSNSDVRNIRFDFANNMELVFDSTYSQDGKYNSYQSLLEKFSAEGKNRSYKNLNLQYKKFHQSRFAFFLEKIWWGHGYKKALVFLWTIFFLIVFFLVNYKNWQIVHPSYPIIEWKKEPYYYNYRQKSRIKLTAVLHTMYVFFSLKVDFNKLKTDKWKPLLFFWLQYFTGLWCLIFIVRFIFKL